MQNIHVSYPVPYYAQIASPELAESIFSGQMPPEADPRWAESGAQNVSEYAYWVERACGLACVKMCVEALDGPVRTLLDWAEDGLKIGGYLTRSGPDGQIVEIGWKHSSLTHLCIASGLSAHTMACSMNDFPAMLARDQLLIASVSYEVGTSGPITKKGGHLVVITGVTLDENIIREVIVHNPSGRSRALQAYAHIPADRFAEGFTGRVIVVGYAGDRKAL